MSSLIIRLTNADGNPRLFLRQLTPVGLASSASCTATILSWLRPVLLLPGFLAFLFRLVPYCSDFRTLSHGSDCSRIVQTFVRCPTVQTCFRIVQTFARCPRFFRWGSRYGKRCRNNYGTSRKL